jgi:leucyl aminopeptidase
VTQSFNNILIADEGQAAVPLTLIRATDLSEWLSQQSDESRNWALAQKFKARPGELLQNPLAHGGTAIILGVATLPDLSVWDLAPAAAKLSTGNYRLNSFSGNFEIGDAYIGWLLAHYEFSRYKKSTQGEARKLLVKNFSGIADAIAQTEAIALVRDLVTTPSSDLGPAELAVAAREIAERFNCTYSEIIGDALLAQNFPAVHAVGRASPRLPRLIDFSWGNPEHPLVSLVGKGVCFDTGGYNLKPGNSMALMKKDMGGAAHVLALAQLIMAAALPVRLRVIIPAVENMVAGNAFAPGDVLQTRKGISVEVTNTDAEGRLILADALALACEDKPDLILDFATLTGAARTAMGWEIPPFFTPDEKLAAEFQSASQKTNDPLWRLPLWQRYADMLKSPIADLQNSPDSGLAGAITAALFLQKFVDTSSWAHFDVYAWNPSSTPGRPKGGEAMALRASFELIRRRYDSRYGAESVVSNG